MQLTRNSILAIFACLLFAHACERDAPPKKPEEITQALALLFEVSPQPARVGQATFTIKLSEPSGAPAGGAVVKLEGNMSHPGMTPVFAEAKEVERGHYRATMGLSMAGDWAIRFRATMPDDRKLDVQHVIRVNQ